MSLLTQSWKRGRGLLRLSHSISQALHRGSYRDGQAKRRGFQTKGDPEWSPERIQESSEKPAGQGRDLPGLLLLVPPLSPPKWPTWKDPSLPSFTRTRDISLQPPHESKSKAKFIPSSGGTSGSRLYHNPKCSSMVTFSQFNLFPRTRQRINSYINTPPRTAGLWS